MAPTALVKKTVSKSKSKLAEKEGALLSPELTGDPSSDDEEGWEDEDGEVESESDEDDEGVDEVGFENLIKALGDDGLDEYDQANLAALAGDGEEDEEGEEDEDSEEDEKQEREGVPDSEVDEEVSGDGDELEEEGPGSASEDVLALDELEDVELHPDAVPRRGVKVIDNKVSPA